MRGDARSRRVAVVADVVVNPPHGDRDRLAELASRGWGVVALPQPGLPDEVAEAMVTAAVDEVIAFLDGGYEVVLVPEEGDPEMRRFRAALAAAGRTIAATGGDLTDADGAV
ncbi:MAG TPA: hypothetical protein VE777_21315 [Gaiellales bacterium]|nr:hypothetical protein [Gaiellales bacterium]